MPDTLTKLAYQTFQQGKQTFGFAHKTLSARVMNFISPRQRTEPNRIDPQLLEGLQKSLNSLLETDWQDAEDGVYPKHLLFDNPWDDFLRYYPMVVLDIPAIWERASQKRHQDFATGINTEGYPDYYVQNFHHQTDGYFSDLSANLYDLQVELLFNGSADPMRRRLLKPLKQHIDRLQASQQINTSTPQPVKVLDIACGTGRTLKLMRETLPAAALYGVDLSPAYLRKANQLLSQTDGTLPQLIHANAEALPYLDSYFEAVSSVFLFHELPAAVRQTVIDEAFRVVKPGGVFIICDSIQQEDSPQFAPMMENFPAMFHEPYYRHYTTDNITERLSSAGFERVEVFNFFMSKYWAAYKPAADEAMD
ncbi:MAG: class I SAM-dependent methyltransferase [Leptolyngbya sp. SIO4C1]|nr:class I SAM-dependent methyltransferase [Leptolyngbya sp. SIO4C1]